MGRPAGSERWTHSHTLTPMRVRRGIFASIVLFVLFLFSTSAAGSVVVTQGGTQTPSLSDEEHEHMQQDLAGTPMSVIEAQTATNAARITFCIGPAG